MIKRKTYWFTLIIYIIFSILTDYSNNKVYAENVKQDTQEQKENKIENNEKSPDGEELGEVVVEAAIDKSEPGKTKFKQKIIKSLPTKNGTLNEIVSKSSNVQLDEKSYSSEKGGEILPPEISIAGAKPYQNNIMIDGVNINNRIDPAADNPMVVDEIASHSQQRFVDPRLLDEVVVYENNIPAEYGGFTGGVVDAKIKKPGNEVKAVVSYKTTNHNFTKINTTDDRAAYYEENPSHDYQPKFYKHNIYSFLEFPLNDRFACLFSYSQIYSYIPIKHFDQQYNQKRQKHEIFGKIVYDVDDDSSIDLSYSSTPYMASYIIHNVKDSNIVIKNIGSAVNLQYLKNSSLGQFTLVNSFEATKYVRDSAKDWKMWQKTDSKPWGRIDDVFFDEKGKIILEDYNTSLEGGFGKIEQNQYDYEAKTSFEFIEFDLGVLKNRFKFGGSYLYTFGNYERFEHSYMYKAAVINDQVVGDGSEYDYVHNEQYFSRRLVRDPGYSEAAVNQFSLYFQNEITLYLLKLFPGIRYEYDDFLRNKNISGRFKATLDIFGNEDTVFFGGLNRYYYTSLLTYKLREAIKPVRTEYRTVYHNNLQPWLESAHRSNLYTKFSHLKTPYNDELAFGIKQKIWKTTFRLTYTNRKGKDEFARELLPDNGDGKEYFVMNNNGTTQYHGVDLGWNLSLEKHSVIVKSTWSKSTSSNNSYDDNLDSDNIDQKVWYKGEIIYYRDLPRQNYNRPVVVDVIYNAELPANLFLTIIGNFRSGYQKLVKLDETKPVPNGLRGKDPYTGEVINETLYQYQEKRMPHVFKIDLRFAWKCNIHEKHDLIFTTDVTNVFNKKSPYRGSHHQYEMGRQFWLGLEYNY